MLQIESKDYMTMEKMKEAAPSIFTESPSSNVSSKYTHIPTNIIIKDMDLLGWKVVDVKEVKARKSKTIGFQKHLIVFRNPDVSINGGEDDVVYPQILLTNSHDGKSAFTFTAGLFRMICENGLVVSTNEFENVKIRHMGYDFEVLQNEIRGMVERLPLTVESMNKMISTKMQEEQIIKFAKDCLAVRFTEKELKRIKVNMEEFVTPVRKEDESNDLWSIFNVVQEKIIEGDFEYSSGTKIRKARKIRNFKQDMKVNSKLFDVALTYIN